MQEISVIDSHTGGEPTRLIIGGGPDLGSGTIAERSTVFTKYHASLISATIGEPRASDVFVGGLVCTPSDNQHSTGVIFFDADGIIRMCGHGTIGLLVSLHHLGVIETGRHLVETEVGTVDATLIDRNTVQFKNVPSRRSQKDLPVKVAEYGQVNGDVAWGGNWFFLAKESPIPITIANAPELTKYAKAIRKGLQDQGVTGEDGDAIRHIEIYGPSDIDGVSAKNFVLCPGGAYDRSPCGTGTSAKVACLAADGSLKPGELWRQESIVGSIFECSYEIDEQENIVPIVQGQAFVTGEVKLLLDPKDPFCHGIPTV